MPTRPRTGAAVVVVLTEWDEFRWLDFDQVHAAMAAAGHRRRPQPARPGRRSPHGLRLHRHRTPMSRVVVAGGAGFLGSHLCDRLIGRGDAVVCLDDLSTGSEDNVAHLLAHDRFRLVVTDVSEKVELATTNRSMPSATWPRPASPPAYLARPLETLAVGSEGTRRLLELAREHDARFLMASTSEIYGDPTVHPQVESYRGNVDPIGPRSVYDEAKRFAESLTMARHRTHGVNVGIVRIFNTYGPRLSPGDGRVVSNFIVQAPAGRAAHHLRRRHPDPEPLLRRRRDRGAAGPARLVADRSGQHRQSGRAHHARAGPTGARDHRVVVGDRVPAAAQGRSDPALPRHHAGPDGCWVGRRRSTCARVCSAPWNGSRSRRHDRDG